MVPREPSEGRVKVRRIVTTDLNPGCTEVVPETMGCLSETAHPIVNQAYTNSLPRLGDQCVRKHLSAGIFVDDVAFEMDVLLGRGDCVQPSGVVLCGVF